MWRDRRGSISILAALMLPILMALAALVVDCGYALSQRAALQQAADSAALSGAMAYISSASATATRATINDVVTANGWASSTIVAGSTGYLAASPTDASVHAVQVTLTATSPLWFGAVFVSRSALGLQAYALANLPGETACIISLGTLTINSVVNAGTCDVAADSTASYAVQINSPGGLTAGKFYSPGTITDDGYLHATIVTKTLSDPYTAVQTAATSGFSSCSSYKYYTSGTSTMSPGCWDSPTITSAVTLSPGVYYMNYGMTLQSGGSITGTGGVTIVSSTGLAVAGNITLTAPTSGSYSGIALYVQDGGIDFDNGVKYAINGAVYAPNLSSGGLTFDTGTSNQNACTTLVAGNISFCVIIAVLPCSNSPSLAPRSFF
jgi:hypothetical protein